MSDIEIDNRRSSSSGNVSRKKSSKEQCIKHIYWYYCINDIIYIYLYIISYEASKKGRGAWCSETVENKSPDSRIEGKITVINIYK